MHGMATLRAASSDGIEKHLIDAAFKAGRKTGRRAREEVPEGEVEDAPSVPDAVSTLFIDGQVGSGRGDVDGTRPTGQRRTPGSVGPEPRTPAARPRGAQVAASRLGPEVRPGAIEMITVGDLIINRGEATWLSSFLAASRHLRPGRDRRSPADRTVITGTSSD